MAGHLDHYVQYIRNTGAVPCPIAWFDEDNDPIGPMVRADLVAAGLVTESPDGLRIVEQASQWKMRTRPVDMGRKKTAADGLHGRTR